MIYNLLCSIAALSWIPHHSQVYHHRSYIIEIKKINYFQYYHGNKKKIDRPKIYSNFFIMHSMHTYN